MYAEDKEDAKTNPTNTRCVNCGKRFREHNNRMCNADEKRAAYLQKKCTCGSGLADGLCANCWPQ